VLAVVTAFAALWACDSPGFDAAAATELAGPHLSHFTTFDTWARRALVADPAIRNRAALEETLFAPIRREQQVLGAWVDGGLAGPPMAFGHLPAPPGLLYRTVRDEALGEIAVATEKVPDPRVPFAEEAARPRAVIIRMTRENAEGIEVTVTVAYRALH